MKRELVAGFQLCLLVGACTDEESRVGRRAMDSMNSGMRSPSDASHEADALSPLPFVATAQVGERPAVTLPGNGDLWPSCWSDDGHLYAAWGDGWGFAADRSFVDIGVAQISGSPREGNLAGRNLATGDAVGQVWASGYSRKPTGMACVGGDLYLAVQNLAEDFNDAPSATVARSRDKGRTWEWDRSGPMFRDHELTTIFFLDPGQEETERSGQSYVYAYALDGNWRDSFTNRVADPSRLWLARVPPDALQNRDRWEWFAAFDAQGAPKWSTDSHQRVAVLIDERKIYTTTTPDLGNNVANLSVLSQGGVSYNAPLDRYIYTSWTEYTFEFYEAPSPWGPFHLFFSKDFGGYPWSSEKSGGYAATIPTKFISEDGKSMYLQSNTFWGGADYYSFNLREFAVEPYGETSATNRPGDPIPTRGRDAVAIGSSFRFGHPEVLSDGSRTAPYEDSRTGAAKTDDHWGYTWPRVYSMNRLVYTTGDTADCGAFDQLAVEIRRRGEWHSVEFASTPSYPLAGEVGAYRTYEFAFETTSGDGIRLRGKPSGASACTSISELSVSYTIE